MTCSPDRSKYLRAASLRALQPGYGGQALRIDRDAFEMSRKVPVSCCLPRSLVGCRGGPRGQGGPRAGQSDALLRGETDLWAEAAPGTRSGVSPKASTSQYTALCSLLHFGEFCGGLVSSKASPATLALDCSRARFQPLSLSRVGHCFGHRFSVDVEEP